MVAGTKYRGEFEERLKGVLDETQKSRAILFIDEMHTMIGAGDSEGGGDLANVLKPYLARGDISVIGATTLAEYRRYIERDGALERRFQPLTVEEPTPEATLQHPAAPAPALRGALPRDHPRRGAGKDGRLGRQSTCATAISPTRRSTCCNWPRPAPCWTPCPPTRPRRARHRRSRAHRDRSTPARRWCPS